MGNCSSGDMVHVPTARLILEDGQLREFPYPVKVSYLLQKYPMCFICNSDEMDFNDVMRAIDEDEVLKPGQLYFALPLSRLNHPLRADEMAALAVKASSALMKGGAGEKYICRRAQIAVPGDENSKSCQTVSHRVSGARGVGRSKIGRRGGGSGDQWAKSTATLSTIPEYG
ncbi:uncharacterized protein LOC114719158 [Neltuma alba]|uniref:uncharacterized protein LOC114719158 n=1 Tax=Neltuma alba TaxID=207710 RepID=UPI0010A55306|nr:uncharacterized protein LOC114719158 [Prosopis alba]